MTADHLQPMLDNEHDSELLSQAASILAQGTIPGEVLDGLRLGRLTALRKPDGGVRGSSWEMLTKAKQVAKDEEATAPFQYALTTKAGCQCVAHILQTITDLDNRATVVSIDGVGAYDLIPRNAMMEGLWSKEIRSSPLYGASTEARQRICGRMKQGTCKTSHKEGGEQGDPVMPLLFSLGLHGALSAVKARLRDGEEVFFLDDVYVICAPERVLDIHKILEEEIFAHWHIRVHHGKAQVEPRECDSSGRGDIDKGGLSQQGIKILGDPSGSTEYVRQFLEEKADEHRTLFQRIPMVEDPQPAWLLLLMCALTRANFWLRGVQPEWTSIFAETHDAHVWECIRRILNCHGGDQQKSLFRYRSLKGV